MTTTSSNIADDSVLQDITVQDSIRNELAIKPGAVLEDIALRHQVSLLDTIRCLAPEMWKLASGEHFVEIMQDIASWGDVTTIVHTRDVIMEFKGPVPAGRIGHGFYNLQGSVGLTGHLSHTHCKTIAFVRRPFMGMATACILFLNDEGNAMFKVFAGRDAQRNLREDHLQRFGELERRLTHHDA